MSKELNEKLNQIVNAISVHGTASGDVERIKQAFRNDGWTKLVFSKDGELNLMTGQVFYDRFMKLAPRQLTEADELDFNLHDDDPEGNCYYAWNCAVAGIEDAARKAANL